MKKACKPVGFFCYRSSGFTFWNIVQ